MDELISRQQAIDALDVLCQEHRYKIPGKRETYSQYNEAWQDALDRAENAIGNLPSAEPKIIHCEDCKYGMLDHSFSHQWFCKFKGDEWNNSDYFCGHARKREVAT